MDVADVGTGWSFCGDDEGGREDGAALEPGVGYVVYSWTGNSALGGDYRRICSAVGIELVAVLSGNVCTAHDGAADSTAGGDRDRGFRIGRGGFAMVAGGSFNKDRLAASGIGAALRRGGRAVGDEPVRAESPERDGLICPKFSIERERITEVWMVGICCRVRS